MYVAENLFQYVHLVLTLKTHQLFHFPDYYVIKNVTSGFWDKHELWDRLDRYICVQYTPFIEVKFGDRVCLSEITNLTSSPNAGTLCVVYHSLKQILHVYVWGRQYHPGVCVCVSVHVCVCVHVCVHACVCVKILKVIIENLRASLLAITCFSLTLSLF